MFDIKQEQLIKSCKPILNFLFGQYRQIFIDLFFHENDIYFEKIDLEPLIKIGLLKQLPKGLCRANVQIWPIDGKFVVTDFVISKHKKKEGLYTRKSDDVWHIIPEESAFIAKTAILKRGETVLDLATGSGIIALFCADKAERVYATDINPKAINYAKFNAILNNVEERIDFRVGDLFEPVRGLKFDLIIWNGPTIAAPTLPNSFPLYVYGGRDGASFTRRFVDEVEEYMKPTTKLQFYEASLGDENESEGIKYMLRVFSGNKMGINILRLSRRPQDFWKVDKIYIKYFIPNAPFNFKKLPSKTIKDWYTFIKENKLDKNWLSMIIVLPTPAFEIKKFLPTKNIRTYSYYSRKPYQFLSNKTIIEFIKRAECYNLKGYFPKFQLESKQSPKYT